MRTFIKIIFLLIILAAIAAVVAYSIYKDDLHQEIRTLVSRKLSEASAFPVSVGSVHYIPFQSLSLDHVTVYSPENTDLLIADADNIIITFDVPAIIREKYLKTTITTSGMHSGNFLLSGTFRTLSRKSESFEGVFDPSLIYSVSILDAHIGFKDFAARNVIGILDIDNMQIPKGKIIFSYKGRKYLVDFRKMDTSLPGYNISLRSDDLGFTARIVKDKDRLTVDDLEGMYRTFHFDLTGEVADFLKEEAVSSFNGTLEAELGTFPLLPGETGKAARKLDTRGKVNANLFFKLKGTDIKKTEASATILAEEVFLDKLWIKEISTKMTLKDGRLSAPVINGEIYSGVLSGEFKSDIWEKDLPFMLNLVLTSVDFESLITDLNGNIDGVYGILDADVNLEGYAPLPSSYKGDGSITISDANLGSMPIVTPLLGDIYESIKYMLPEARMVNINHAYADFDIENRKVKTDDLTFLGDNIYVHAEGYLDFDGNLDFKFENRFREPPSEDEGWQVAIRNSMIYVGKFIKKSRLRGTIQNPVWGV